MDRARSRRPFTDLRARPVGLLSQRLSLLVVSLTPRHVCSGSGVCVRRPTSRSCPHQRHVHSGSGRCDNLRVFNPTLGSFLRIILPLPVIRHVAFGALLPLSITRLPSRSPRVARGSPSSSPQPLPLLSPSTHTSRTDPESPPFLLAGCRCFSHRLATSSPNRHPHPLITSGDKPYLLRVHLTHARIELWL